MGPDIRIGVDRQQTQTLIANVIALDKKVRRRGLERVGRAVIKIQKPLMRKLAAGRSKTGALVKSIDGKSTVNKARTRVTTIVGPLRGKTAKGKKLKLRFAVTRRTRAGAAPVLNRQGQQLFRQPTRYAHLAGPRRKSTIVQRTVAGSKAAVEQKTAAVLRETIEGA